MKNSLDLLTRSALWCIRPEAISTAVLDLTSHVAVANPWEAVKPSLMGSGPHKIAIVPVQGVLTKDGPSWYGSNYDTISRAVEDAALNPEVKHIVLAVDSPGGEVFGLPETAAVIAQAAKTKPVSAIVDGQSASAAYWLTSQARDITLTPSGEVGSVGVRMMHADVSGMLEQAGVKITELSAGAHKTEWSPYQPLSDEAKADMQPRLEAVHQTFLNEIGAARGARAGAAIREKRFGEGRMLSASDALNAGMVDKLQSSRDFFRAILPPVEQELSAPAFPIRHSHAVLVLAARVLAGQV